ncbi:hypothetical protein G9A89_018753 [Geosiphon pyriformis]|nr:hypothetical protein G9A89_018753 [Geosiphon pyriformis]
MANNSMQQNILIALQDIQTVLETSILISKWYIKLEKKTQGAGKVVTKYAKAIRKLIKQVNSVKNWTEKQKIYFFTKELRTYFLYVFWPFLVLKNNSTIDMTIKLAQKIENNQRMHLESTLPVFVSALIMTSVLYMAITFFAIQTQDPNKQLIDRLTANFAQLLESLAQAVRDN